MPDITTLMELRPPRRAPWRGAEHPPRGAGLRAAGAASLEAKGSAGAASSSGGGDGALLPSPIAAAAAPKYDTSIWKYRLPEVRRARRVKCKIEATRRRSSSPRVNLAQFETPRERDAPLASPRRSTHESRRRDESACAHAPSPPPPTPTARLVCRRPRSRRTRTGWRSRTRTGSARSRCTSTCSRTAGPPSRTRRASDALSARRERAALARGRCLARDATAARQEESGFLVPPSHLPCRHRSHAHCPPDHGAPFAFRFRARSSNVAGTHPRARRRRRCHRRS